MKPSVVGTGRLASGVLFCVTTTGSRNVTWTFDGATWSPANEWAGKEVTACCNLGEQIVCPALDHFLYVVKGADTASHLLPDESEWIHGACELENNVVLMAGERGLFFYDASNGRIWRKRLGDFDISKPGRRVIRICRSNARVFLVGAKNLLVEFHGESATNLLARGSRGGRELTIYQATVCEGKIWTSGILGTSSFLALIDNGHAMLVDCPMAELRAPIVTSYRDQLLLASDRILYGFPGDWQTLWKGDGNGIVGIMESNGCGTLCAVTYKGCSYFFDGSQWHKVPILE